MSFDTTKCLCFFIQQKSNWFNRLLWFEGIGQMIVKGSCSRGKPFSEICTLFTSHPNQIAHGSTDTLSLPFRFPCYNCLIDFYQLCGCTLAAYFPSILAPSGSFGKHLGLEREQSRTEKQWQTASVRFKVSALPWKRTGPKTWTKWGMENCCTNKNIFTCFLGHDRQSNEYKFETLCYSEFPKCHYCLY